MDPEDHHVTRLLSDLADLDPAAGFVAAGAHVLLVEPLGLGLPQRLALVDATLGFGAEAGIYQNVPRQCHICH